MIREAKKVVVLDKVSGDFTFIEGRNYEYLILIGHPNCI
jgi:hypothetical protein